jgi:hypothetical protein
MRDRTPHLGPRLRCSRTRTATATTRRASLRRRPAVADGPHLGEWRPLCRRHAGHLALRGQGRRRPRRGARKGLHRLRHRPENAQRPGPAEQFHVGAGQPHPRPERQRQPRRHHLPKRPDLKGIELGGATSGSIRARYEFGFEGGGAQYGMSFDNYGRKFGCSNSDHLQFWVYDGATPRAIPSTRCPLPPEHRGRRRRRRGVSASARTSRGASSARAGASAAS